MSNDGIAIASRSVQSDPAPKGRHIQLGSEGRYVLSASPNSGKINSKLVNKNQYS